MSKPQRLNKDKWGRNEVYCAEWDNEIGAGRCLFSRLDPAIFYVVSAIGGDIDWSKFPDPAKHYPYEDRNGSNHRLTPVFIVDQVTRHGRNIRGRVEKMAVADDWIVGNGIALAARKWFAAATGRDIVELSGAGERLQGKIGARG